MATSAASVFAFWVCSMTSKAVMAGQLRQVVVATYRRLLWRQHRRMMNLSADDSTVNKN